VVTFPEAGAAVDERLAISARITLNHLISSSSVGAQSRRVRFAVTILNTCWSVSAASTPEAPPPALEPETLLAPVMDGLGSGGGTDGEPGRRAVSGRSTSRASRICETEISRWCFVSI